MADEQRGGTDMTDEDDNAHSWLGRLFSSLVRTDGEEEGAQDMTPPDVTEATPARSTSTLDVAALRIRLVQATEPVASLVELVHDIRTRETAAGTDGTLPPGAFELYLARRLEDAGLLATDVGLPGIRVIVPHTSGMFYLHVNEQQVPYLVAQRVLGIEAALNAALLADAYLVDSGSATEEDLVGLEARIATSIVAQVPSIDIGSPAPDEGNPNGEWSVRRGISSGIECARLPYRLMTDFRVNVAGRDVAFQVALVSPELFGTRAIVDGVGVVPATTDMRRRAATDYNLRLGVLLAALAFRCSPTLERAWVAGTVDTATAHACYYSVTFTRAEVERACADGFDPIELMRSCGASMDEHDGRLEAVRQSFRLEDELFCPPARYDAVELSSRLLDDTATHALGTARVSGLSVDEGRRRETLAADVSRDLTSSTEANVRMIMEKAGNDPDPSVRGAAERVVGMLIEGTLSDDDPVGISEAIMSGDPLSRAAAHANEQLSRHDAEGAERTLTPQLMHIDAARTYEDTDTTEWRFFGSYVDRVIYNRLLATGRTILLVPAAYVDALIVSAFAELARNNAEKAIPIARRAVRIAPLNVQACLCLSQCLGGAGDMEGALDAIRELLRYAHDPQTIGLGYYQLAEIEWRLGKLDEAQACYLRALRFLPQALTVIGTELQALLIHEGVSSVAEPSYERLRATLAASGIPMAPTEEVSSVFFDAMRASMDAEIFPVAKNFMAELGSIARDDVYYGMFRSIEDEPDR